MKENLETYFKLKKDIQFQIDAQVDLAAQKIRYKELSRETIEDREKWIWWVALSAAFENGDDLKVKFMTRGWFS